MLAPQLDDCAIGLLVRIFYLLYFAVPGYKILQRDYPDVTVPNSFELTLPVSDWVVIHTRSDLGFFASVSLLIIMLAIVNIRTGVLMRNSKLLAAWSIATAIIPCVLLSIEIAVLSACAHRFSSEYPELLDYEFWWMTLFL